MARQKNCAGSAGCAQGIGTSKRIEERRKHQRKECALRAAYEVRGKEYQGQVSDVSPGGMCLETQHEHEIGDTIDITLRGGNEQPIYLTGVVAYMLKADGNWRVGVEFDDINEATMEALALYLVM
ncbi:MAG: PilZ domain-containing protein [Pseudomonadota bacterium]